MADVNKTYDVFISHAPSDAKLATEIATACRANGLSAITDTELLPAANASDAVWEALAECRAFLTILSPVGPTPAMAIELGAAQAWNKPIFGVLPDPTFSQLPQGFSDIRVYPFSRVEDVIRAIVLSGKELTEDDRSLLATLYSELGVSVDALALEPGRLGDLVKRFDSATGKAVAGERLLSELLRLRKQGRLTKGRSTDRSKPHKGTA